MWKIGILGSDNSHSLAFAKLCNIPDENGCYEYDDVRVTAIYGFDDDPEHTKMVAEEGKIETIVKDPKEFFGLVDAVMVVYRRGCHHVPHILPFVEKGYPVWIDKPIAESLEDVKLLRDAVGKSKALITGGSTLKYTYEVLTLQNKVKNGEFGDVTGGYMNFPADLNSIYNGIFFYGSHLCEMCLSVFGYDIVSVTASSVDPQNIMVIAKYADKEVALNFNAKVKDYTAVVQGTEKTCVMTLDLSIIYKLGFEKFVSMLRNKRQPLSFDNLVKPVYMLNAIQKSLDENREVKLSEL